MEKIVTSKAPAAIGPYSQGVILGDLIITSGQLPVDPISGEVTGDTIAIQAEMSCKNVGAVLTAGGSDFDSVVKTTCFLADMNDFPQFNEIYSRYFTSCPARSCVAVKTLPRNVLCEIEAIAERKGR